MTSASKIEVTIPDGITISNRIRKRLSRQVFSGRVPSERWCLPGPSRTNSSSPRRSVTNTASDSGLYWRYDRLDTLPGFGLNLESSDQLRLWNMMDR
jgi:hypothetical protein